MAVKASSPTLENSCPVSAEVCPWQVGPGYWVVTVVAKAELQLQPGGCSALAPAHPPVAAGDLAPWKAQPEVLLHGSVFASAAAEGPVNAAFTFGGRHKAIARRRESSSGPWPLPEWGPRENAPSDDWVQHWRDRPAPEGFDYAAFNTAPADQRFDALPSPLQLGFVSLHAQLMDFEAEIILPGIGVEWSDGETTTAELLRCDTLHVEPAALRAVAVWRGVVDYGRPSVGSDVIKLLWMPVASGHDRARDQTMTLDAALARRNALPFQQRVSVRALPSTPIPTRERGDTLSTAEVVGEEVMPFDSSTPAPSAPPAIIAPDPLAELGYGRRGPAAVIDEPSPVPADPLPVAQEPAAPAFREPPDVPLEEAAELAAAIEYAPQTKARVLESARLDEARWAQVSRWAQERLATALNAGRSKPIQHYDEAYVARLEQLRGPLTAEDVAHLGIAAERTMLDEMLVVLEIPAAALMRINRVMLRRQISDPSFGKAMRLATQVARQQVQDD